MASSSIKVKAPKRRKLLMLTTVVTLGIVAASAAAYFYSTSHHAEARVIPADPIFVPLEPFTINLLPNGKSRFLHVGLTLKVADIAAQGQVMKYLPEVRSRLLTVLSNREADSLVTQEQKSQLAKELLTALNKPFEPSLPPGKTSSILFTTFILQ